MLSVKADTPLCVAIYMHFCIKISYPPLVSSSRFPLLFLTTTDIHFRLLSNGISSILVYSCSSESFVTPAFAAIISRAVSVGSPMAFQHPFAWLLVLSRPPKASPGALIRLLLHRTATSNSFFVLLCKLIFIRVLPRRNSPAFSYPFPVTSR